MAEYVDDGHFERVTEFIKLYGTKYDPSTDGYSKEPFLSDVRAGKNSPIYNVHSYHTKVPPQGIEPFIEHYTDAGDIVLDPFCGSGMTGVAAIRLKRMPLLIELSPIAAFIAHNYCSIANPAKLSTAAEALLEKSKQLSEWLYGTKCHRCGNKSTIEHTILSDEFECPRCNKPFIFWKVAVQSSGEIAKVFRCPSCNKELRKAQCKRVGSQPVRISYRCPCCGRREDNTNSDEVARLAEIERRWNRTVRDCLEPDTNDDFWPIDSNMKPLWFPSQRMPEGDESRRNDRIGITHVNDFFSVRNLWALSWIWNQIPKLARDNESETALRFAFTSILVISSKMGRYGKRTGNVSGTLYIPSLIKDMNVFRFFRRKVWGPKGIIPGLAEIWNSVNHNQPSIVSVQSATDMRIIPSNSIDYVFTDPPFGGNLMYSELNFIWKSWLDRFTKTENEAIINHVQRKDIAEYQQLMTRSFVEIYRVLKPSRWMTLVFHNSDGDVWQAIQDGLAHAGFSIGMIGIFDKKQRSFKQVTSSGAVGYDVVINCYKPKATATNGINGKTTNTAIVGFLADQLLKLPLIHNKERTDRMLHSKTIGFFMLQNKPLRNLSFEDFQKILKNNFREIDGYWYLPYQRPKTGNQKRLFGYVSNEAEAIEWIEDLLRIPRKYGDILPDFFKALGPNKLQKDLQSILQESFVEENGAWRNPTNTEKEHLTKKLTDKTARQIGSYLEGTSENIPTDDELCEWIEFCYNNGLFLEGSELFCRLNENKITPEVFKKAKRIAEICKLKSWEGSH